MNRTFFASKTSKNHLSAAVHIPQASDFLFVSGQLGIDPATGKMVADDAGAQAAQVMKNLRSVLEEAGFSMEEVVKTMVYAADRVDMPAINAAYADAMGGHKPARSAVLVTFPNPAVKVEVEAIAIRKK